MTHIKPAVMKEGSWIIEPREGAIVGYGVEIRLRASNRRKQLQQNDTFEELPHMAILADFQGS